MKSEYGGVSERGSGLLSETIPVLSTYEVG